MVKLPWTAKSEIRLDSRRPVRKVKRALSPQCRYKVLGKSAERGRLLVQRPRPVKKQANRLTSLQVTTKSNVCVTEATSLAPFLGQNAGQLIKVRVALPKPDQSFWRCCVVITCVRIQSRTF